MTESKSSYNQIIKATGIFGGVQFFNIIINIIRSKIVAVLLGSLGVGIMGLYSATITLISSITNLGLGFSAIRTISEAVGCNDEIIISKTIIALRRWVYFTGVLGGIATLILSTKMSYWTFGNDKYSFAFICLSLTLIFQAINSGHLALLQGLRKLTKLAKVTVIGSIIGLICSIPIYYWLRLEGIVPTMIISSFLSLLISWYFAKKITIKKMKISYKESFKDGIKMVQLGGIMMIAGFANTGVMYLIRLYISKTGSVEQVGLYTAAWAILNGYVGMIFNAMGTDYFPRLSAINEDNYKIKKYVNEQAEIAILIITPFLITLLGILPILIKLLYTSKFLPIMSLIKWAIIGMPLKAVSWSIGYIFLAKGNGKLFFKIEVLSNLFILIVNILSYHYFGLEGIGIAFLITYVFSLFLIFIIAKYKYNYSFEINFIKIFVIHSSILFILFLISYHIGFPITYYISPFFFLLSLIYSFIELRERVDLISILQQFKIKTGK